MKKMIMPLSIYLAICIITILIPASEGYNTIGWKLLVGQIYAIPVLIMVTLITLFVNKKRLKKINT